MKLFIKILTMGIISVGLAQAAIEVAKVNGRAITDSDMAAALSGMNEGAQKNALKDPDTRKQVIEGLVNQALLLQEAEKLKLDGDSEYKEALAQFRKQFLTNRVLQKNLSAKITEPAAKKFYETHRPRYSTDQVRAQHILVKDEKQAQELLKEAKAEGADFQAMAEKNSADPSAKNNRGDLGYFGRDRMVKEFSDAAFQAAVGDIIGPVKTTYGYHVIKVIDKKVGKPLEYDEVELRVKNDLKQELIQNYLAGLRKTAKIVVNDASAPKSGT